MTKIAIMQPYFMPYAGYFRLISSADIFVIYDDVQFPKGGWVHRNRLLNLSANPEWLTIPIKRMPLNSKINEMQFIDNAHEKWQQSLRKFPAMANDIQNLVKIYKNDTPLEFIMRSLHLICEILDIDFKPIYSSALGINNLSGQDRVIEIVKNLGGTQYINAPGGRKLYDKKSFKEAGIQLSFLPDYEGSMMSILQRVINEPATCIRSEIIKSFEFA